MMRIENLFFVIILQNLEVASLELIRGHLFNLATFQNNTPFESVKLFITLESQKQAKQAGEKGQPSPSF